ARGVPAPDAKIFGAVQQLSVLNRLVSWTASGIMFEADPRHVDLVLEAEFYGLVSAASSSLGEQSMLQDWGISCPITILMEVKRGLDDRRQHPAKLAFQGIRNFINQEMQQLAEALDAQFRRLKFGGRAVVITFKPREEQVLENWLRHNEDGWASPLASMVSPDRLGQLFPLLSTVQPYCAERLSAPVRPSAAELCRNGRARSAAVHCFVKMPRKPPFSRTMGLVGLSYLAIKGWALSPRWLCPVARESTADRCVTSYGQISLLLGAPWTPRLVGQALKKNPFAPEVPCHRVVRADRTLGGYFGATAFEDEKVQTKVRLLEEEGVLLERKGEAWLVRAGCFWSFPSVASAQAAGRASAQAGEGVSLYPAKRKAEGAGAAGGVGFGARVRQVDAAVKEPLPASLAKAPRGRFGGALPRLEEGRRDFARIFFADQRKIFFLGPNMTSMMPLQPTGGPSSAHIGDLNEQVVDKAETLFRESLVKQLEQAFGGPPKEELLHMLVKRAMAATTVNVGIDFATTMQLMPTFLQPLFLLVVRGDGAAQEVRSMAEAPENAPGARKVLADEVAAPFRAEIRQAVAAAGGVGPKLIGFLANADPAAKKYAEWTGKAMTADNLRFELRQVQEGNLEDELEKANREPDVDGIMIYYPVFGSKPSFHGGSHDDYLRDTVSPFKDAEGLNHFYRRALYRNTRFVDA
ncbi:unnamed protein product, partial [Effrenium voratum]